MVIVTGHLIVDDREAYLAGSHITHAEVAEYDTAGVRRLT